MQWVWVSAREAGRTAGTNHTFPVFSKTVPLSDSSNICRIEILASDEFEMLFDDLKKTDIMSIVVDESQTELIMHSCAYMSVFWMANCSAYYR